MNRFCKECGHANAPENLRCTACGEALGPLPSRVEKPSPKQALPLWKKALVLFSSIVVLAAIAFSFYGITAYSESSLPKKLTAAVRDQDATAVRNLVQLTNGREVTDAEIKALLTFVDEQPDGLREIIKEVPIRENGKFLYLFDRYAYTFPGVTVVDEIGIAGISYTFNTEEFSPKSTDSGVSYGPLLPGIYEVQAFYVNDKEEVIEDEAYSLEAVDLEKGAMASLTTGFEFLTPSFSLLNFDETLMSDLTLTLGEREFEFNGSDMTSDAPILASEVTSAVITYTLPWGEHSYELESVEEYNDILLPLITKEVKEELTQEIKTASDHYSTMWTTQSFDHFTNISPSIVNTYKDEFGYNFNNEFYLYATRVNSLKADFENAYSQDGTLFIPTAEARDIGYYEPGSSPDFDTYTEYTSLGFTYNPETQKWQLSELDYLDYFDGPGENVPVSNEVLYSSEELEVAAAPAIAESSIEQFIYEENYDIDYVFFYYMESSIEAINERDYSLVSGYMHPDGKRGPEARDYIEYLDSKGIYEDLVDTELQSIERISDDTVIITSIDVITIHKPDSSETKTFKTRSTFKEFNGEWLCYELLETTEL